MLENESRFGSYCRPPRPILRKTNAVCIEDDEDDFDGFDPSGDRIPMRSMSNRSRRVKKTSLGSNSHLTIPTGKRSFRHYHLAFDSISHRLRAHSHQRMNDETRSKFQL